MPGAVDVEYLAAPQGRLLGGLQDAVYAPEHRKRENHPAVLMRWPALSRAQPRSVLSLSHFPANAVEIPCSAEMNSLFRDFGFGTGEACKPLIEGCLSGPNTVGKSRRGGSVPC